MTDYKYEIERDKLIPHAEATANDRHGSEPAYDRIGWGMAWNKTFLSEMDRMAREAGLVKWGCR